jgi:hypothetical protein
MHHYFYDPNKLDLAVIREQANAKTKPNTKFGSDATESVIHLHKFDSDCRGHQHEFYAPGGFDDRQALVQKFWEAVIEAEEMETLNA